MIKFFRNIRMKLASENPADGRAGKASAYLRYAIGEIVLVMIGILLALQVNNWNELRKQNIAENEFIQGVKNDLIQDKKYIEFILKKTEPKTAAFDLLCEIDSLKMDSIDKNSIDSLLQIYFSREGARTFYPVSGSFQAALSGNELNNYKNKKLTASLIKLYNSTYTRLMDNSRMLNERWDYLRKKYIHQYRTRNFRVTDKARLSEVMDDLYYHYLMLQWYRGVLNDARVEIDELLDRSNE